LRVLVNYSASTLRVLRDVIRAEATAGMLLLAMVPIALVWANGPFSHSYETFWSTSDLHRWVNDGLMTLFFFVVALEVKREVIGGELQLPSKVLTPAMAALGGMIVPALLYALVNVGDDGLSGWGIPMATDIAIVLGILSLLGDRVPPSLKTFLLTLAIVDGIDFGWLLGAGVAAAVYLFGARVNCFPLLLIPVAFVAWYATLESGVHATLMGVVLALLTPAAWIPSLEKRIHPWSSYFVLPVFALSNAGVTLSSDALVAALSSNIAWGVVAGLLAGKPVGVCLSTAITVRWLGGHLPSGLRAGHIVAGSVLTAVGFTVSLFMTNLAFTDVALVEQAKTGVLAASTVAGAVGCCVLWVYVAKSRQ
jgi:Na+:H+ antiporter, NhaA family